MATANPLEEFLSTEVDEHEISVLVGSLESQLASPTGKESMQPNSNVAGHINHSINKEVSSRVGSSVAHHASELKSASQGATHVTVNGSKDNSVTDHILGIGAVNSNVSSNPSSGVPSVLNPGGQNAVASTPGLVAATGPRQNSSDPTKHTIQTSVSNISMATVPSAIGSTNSGTVNTASTNVNSNVTPAKDGNGGSAMYKLASVAAAQQPLQVPNSSVALTVNRTLSGNEALVNRPVNANAPIGSNGNGTKPSVVIKPQQQIFVSRPPAASTGPRPTVVNVSASSPRPSTPNAMTVVRGSTAAASTPTSQIQIVNVNAANQRPQNASSQPRSLAPRITNQPIRIAPQQVMASPQQVMHPRSFRPPHQRPDRGGAIVLPAGTQIPPGTVLVKNQQGQLYFVQNPNMQSQSSTAVTGAKPTVITAQGQQQIVQSQATSQGLVRAQMSATTAASGIRPQAPIPTVVHPGANTLSQRPPHQSSTMGQSSAAPTQSSILDNVRKCKNFLSTLIKLAASQPPQTVRNVKQLIQGLIDGNVEPETFTSKLQVELKSSPQPYLVPFLKKSLPLLRQSLVKNQMSIDGVKAPSRHPSVVMGQRPMMNAQRPGMLARNQNVVYHRMGMAQSKPSPANQTKSLLSRPAGAMMHIKQEATPHREKRKFDSLKDDDDINDVATMGGVNLTEESRNILATNSELMSGQMRSCQDENFLVGAPLMNRINAIARKHGLACMPQEVANLISHATQERLRNIVERLAVIAEHRIEIYKTDSRYETSTEVRGQIKFLEELDKLEKKKHEEAEREVLLRAAKSRSKNEDPEQMKLKEKAKAMQQAEMEELRQRNANFTALQAIGPRKKAKLDQGIGLSTPGSSSGNSSNSRQISLRPRIKRVNLKDLVFLLEQDRESNKSSLLYKSYLK